MISQTGPMRKAKAPEKVLIRAFTLIELLIVSVIIFILIGFATPLFRKTFTDLELKEAASNISKLIALAQQEAIINQSGSRVRFNAEKNTYSLGEKGRRFNLPRSVNIEPRSQDITINFYPDGHCDKVELKLVGKEGKALKIATTGILGNVVITETEE